MLALRQLRCLLHSTPTSQTRTLRTLPRPIPTYTKQWDPTIHNPRRPSKSSIESLEPYESSRTTLEQSPPGDVKDDLQQVKIQQHGAEDVVIEVNSSSSRIVHAMKKLAYLLNLANSDDVISPDLRAPLWKAYLLAMKYKTSVPKHLSQRAWNILWKSRYADFLDVSRRENHLAKLNRDFLKAPTSPVAGQVAYSIEQKFMAGMQEQALDMWAGSRHDFATAPEYLDVGTRLYALAGHADQSRDIMDHLLQLDPNWDPTIIMAVFRAYTSSGLDQHIDKAREMYRAIKERMGTESVLEAYDSCMVGFLETRSLPDAKQVFQDMIRAGCLETTGSESHVQGVIRRLNLLYALGTDITSMSGIALDAINVLPVGISWTHIHRLDEVCAG